MCTWSLWSRQMLRNAFGTQVVVKQPHRTYEAWVTPKNSKNVTFSPHVGGCFWWSLAFNHLQLPKEPITLGSCTQSASPFVSHENHMSMHAKLGTPKRKLQNFQSNLDLGVHNFDPAHTVHLPITTKAVWQPSKTTATLTLLCLKIGKTSKSREWISKHHFATGFADSETEAWPHPCEFSLATAGALWLHLHLFLSPTQRICCLAGGSLNCPLQS